MKKLDYKTLVSITKENTTYLPLGNYYGGVCLVEHDGSYFMLLDDHSSTGGFEIDSETYNNLLRYQNTESFTIK